MTRIENLLMKVVPTADIYKSFPSLSRVVINSL
jgi:hypothetical protein